MMSAALCHRTLALVMPTIESVAWAHGYAVALHGSLKRERK